MNISHKSLVGTSLLVLLSASGIVQAANNWDWDRKIMTGAQCQPSFGDQWPYFVVNVDGIRNISTVERFVSCTVPIDSETAINQADFDATTPAGRMDGTLRFDYSQVGATGTFTTLCTLYNKSNSTNATTATTTVSVTSGRTTTLLAGNFAGDSLNGIGTLSGTFSFNCRLPPQAKLVSVYYAESSQTDGYTYTP